MLHLGLRVDARKLQKVQVSPGLGVAMRDNMIDSPPAVAEIAI